MPSVVPLSVLEAMATGVACLPELLPDGIGLRVPPADIGALAASLLSLAASGERRERLEEQDRERARAWIKSCQDRDVWGEILRRTRLPRGFS